MNAKSKNTPAPWVDPDDAPELTDEFFAKATPMIADRPASREEYTIAVREAVRRGRPPGSSKVSSTIRFDGDVLAAFRAGGPGWQTRINAALRDWLLQHSRK